MQIGKLARLAGCQVVTIRYYEKIGLMPAPCRTETNYREYGQEAVDRLRFIRHCRKHGMSLREVAELVRLSENPADACGRVHNIVNTHIQNINRQIEELETLKASLQNMLHNCNARENARCAILEGLQDSETCAWCGMCERDKSKNDHKEIL